MPWQLLIRKSPNRNSVLYKSERAAQPNQARKKTNMRTLLLVLFLAASAAAQESYQPTWVSNPLPNLQGNVIQWGLPAGSGGFFPTKTEKKYKFDCTNCIRVQTVGGVTQLYAEDQHDFCTPSCKYTGTFVEFHAELVTEGAAQFYRVSGGLTGTFTDPYGVVSQNVPARYYFETFPNSIAEPVFVPASGGLTVVLTLN